MAKIYYSLGKRISAEGKREVHGAYSGGRGKGNFIRFRTGVYIDPNLWNDKTNSVKIPRIKDETCSSAIKAKEQLDSLQTFLLNVWEKSNGKKIDKITLRKLITDWYDIYTGKMSDNMPKEVDGTINSVFDYMIAHKVFPDSNIKQYECLRRILLRYDLILHLHNRSLNFHTISIEDITGIQNFIISEHTNFDSDGNCIRYQDIYNTVKEPRTSIRPRGWNYTSKMLQRLRTLFHHGERLQLFSNNPFKHYKIKSEIYGDPYYLTKSERDILMHFKFEDEKLAIQRDIFIFQCFVGMRVSDLYALRASNIVGAALEYVPGKTANISGHTVRVPLTPPAQEILNKYMDPQRYELFPFISMQKYNIAIKKILKIAGINRMVTIKSSDGKGYEQKPLCEIASSHMARRTFIGLLYKGTKDPNLIASMSGHVEGSKAFTRYRHIDDDDKKELLSKLL